VAGARDTVRAELDAIKDRERAAHREIEKYRTRLKRAERALVEGLGSPEAAERQRVQCIEIIDRLETETLEAMEGVEEVQPRLDAAQAKVDAAEAALAGAREVATERIAKAKTAARALQTERDAARTPLPREMLNRYDLLRTRKRPPVVPVQKDACSKCMYTIPQQKLMDVVHHDKIMRCRGCGRWLIPGE